MGCGGSKKGIISVEPKKRKPKQNIIQLFKSSKSNQLAINVLSYLTLVELTRVSRVCKYFHQAAGEPYLLQKYQFKLNQPARLPSENYTYTNNTGPTSKEYDFITEQTCNVESHFKGLTIPSARDSDHASLLATPKFISHPPAINDAIKKEVQLIEHEYAVKKSNVELPGHIFSMTDSLENPNVYTGIEDLLRKKSTQRPIKNLSLSGI